MWPFHRSGDGVASPPSSFESELSDHAPEALPCGTYIVTIKVRERSPESNRATRVGLSQTSFFTMNQQTNSPTARQPFALFPHLFLITSLVWGVVFRARYRLVERERLPRKGVCGLQRGRSCPVRRPTLAVMCVSFAGRGARRPSRVLGWPCWRHRIGVHNQETDTAPLQRALAACHRRPGRCRQLSNVGLCLPAAVAAVLFPSSFVA